MEQTGTMAKTGVVCRALKRSLQVTRDLRRVMEKGTSLGRERTEVNIAEDGRKV